ncbi:relaxase/mobilization nuclease domain-containing protein [Terrimonas pollutisoli]|uniref:relaxase/mobilization nuclease domain-containing protein n=1 Tax=Terrimonas pollutisoli TaxID=3034147 RepID=UPI0023EBDECC|nr:relaxase/mobilization nuclease domain-containing protein [Terrimonas sp. H1YJ31]
MVAKIIISKSIEKALNYNEDKLHNGQAQCIHAGNFLQDKEDMNFYDKLHRFQGLIALNERATTNSLHISLNFDPSENLSQKKLSDIAAVYMNKIGFEQQPFLVYEHLDAGHPHIHIVTTNIREDGSRINTHNIGRNQSEKARKEIEQEFSLVKASGRIDQEAHAVNPVNVQKVIYGQSETKRSITNVLDAVIIQYKYTSLAELNAVLKQYNVMADRGYEEGRIYKKGGLVFRVLDEKGNKVGVPIKASKIYSKPTLANLEKKFEVNEEKRKLHKQSIKDRIDLVLQKPESMQQFIRELRKKGIATVLRQNDKGFIYGITFIDHNSKSVFNGSDLGKPYSAAAIQQKIGQQSSPPEASQALQSEKSKPASRKEIKTKDIERGKQLPIERSPQGNDLLEQLMKSEKEFGNTPYELRKKKRKKRKRNLGL